MTSQPKPTHTPHQIKFRGGGRDRQTGRQAGRQPGRHIQRETNRLRRIEADRYRERRGEADTDRQTDRQTERGEEGGIDRYMIGSNPQSTAKRGGRKTETEKQVEGS